MKRRRLFSVVMIGLSLLAAGLLASPSAYAIGSPDPEQSGSVGLEGKISAPPPSQAPTITTPSNGQTVEDSPVRVAGLCKSGLLVKVFDNNVFVGSVMCEGGSYSLQVSLFSGKNDLFARLYDDLDQAGPDSNVVSVTYHDANFAQFGTMLTLTSKYARRGANPNTELTYPIVLSGGTGPYAISVDWGDSSGNDLLSRNFAGDVTLSHTYKQAGIYNVAIKATDKNGSTAYLQVVAVANGEAATTAGGEGGPTLTIQHTSIKWYFFLPIIPLLILAFWLGGRNELYVIRRRLESARNLG